MVKTDEPITQIAYEAGYDSQQAFSLAFKQLNVYPPKIYRTLGMFVPKQTRISLCGNVYNTKNILFINKFKEMAA